MNTVLYTGFDNAYRELSEITVPRMAHYAARSGMEFRAFAEEPVGMDIYWTGMARGLELFNQGFAGVMYLDVDQLITNFGAVWPPVTSGIHFSKDWGNDAVEPWHFSACGFVAYRDSIPFFERVLEMYQDYVGKDFPEQAPMREVVKMWTEGVPLVPKKPGDPYSGLINIHPRRVFNAVPDEISPGNIPEPWQPGDFSAHLTMAPMEKRIEIAKRMAKV